MIDYEHCPQITDTLICEPKYYEKLNTATVALKLKVKFGDLFGIKVVADSNCDPNRAYLFDSNGRLHTIILEP